MKCREIIRILEELAPPKYAESYDNVGLLVGDNDTEVKKIMVALDASKWVVDQAVRQRVDMLVTHHPMIFRPIKNVSVNNFLGEKIIKLAKNNIAHYALHTNMDAAIIATEAAKKLGLVNVRPMEIVYSQKLFKIVVFVPKDYADKVRDAMTREGAGYIGEYSNCTFNAEGTGTFKALEGTTPFIGNIGELTKTPETRIESVITHENMDRVIKAMIKVHPYEEVAYDVYELYNGGNEVGNGRYGYLNKDIALRDLVTQVKQEFNISNVRVVGNLTKRVVTAAILPGAGKSFLEKAAKLKVDVFITGDIDHHAALDALDQDICIIDAGHFDTEYFVVEYIKEHLLKCFTKEEEKMQEMHIRVSKAVEIITADEKSPFTYV